MAGEAELSLGGNVLAYGSKADDIRPDSANSPRAPRMERDDERDFRDQLMELSLEHRALDNEIAALEATGAVDQLHMSRLKRRKLKLKDQMSSLEDQLRPDIIASASSWAVSPTGPR